MPEEKPQPQPIPNDSRNLMDESGVQEKRQKKKYTKFSNMMSVLSAIQNDTAVCFYWCLLAVELFWAFLGHNWLGKVDEDCVEDNLLLFYSLYVALYLLWGFLICGAFLFFFALTVASCDDGSCAQDHCKCVCTCIRDLDDGSAIIGCMQWCCVFLVCICCCEPEKKKDGEQKLSKEQRQLRRIQAYSKNRRSWICSGKKLLKGFSLLKDASPVPQPSPDQEAIKLA